MTLKYGLTSYTLNQFFSRVIEYHCERPALSQAGDPPILYREWAEQVLSIRAALQELGIKQGDRVSIIGPSSPAWVTYYMALVTMGAIAVPIMDDFPLIDIMQIMNHSHSRALIIDDSSLTKLNRDEFPQLLFILTITGKRLFKSPAKNSESEPLNLKPVELFSDGKLNTDLLCGNAKIYEQDLAEILYTSGTTGQPKGVMLTHRNLVHNLFEGPDMLGVINENSIVLSLLPVAHAFGCTSGFLSIVRCGSHLCFLKRKPTPKLLMEAMALIRPTILGGVPLIFEKIYHKQVRPAIQKSPLLRYLVGKNLTRPLVYRLVAKKILKLMGGRLKCAIIGGASLSDEVERFLREGKIPYILGYGLSECSPLVTFGSMEEAKVGSVGRAISDTDIRIVDADPKTGIGEIHVRGPGIMKGYYRNPTATREVFTEDGWFITGDRGILKDNFLSIKGRSKNVIIGASGENIYPELIEIKLNEIPFVEESLVYMSEGKLVARVVLEMEQIRDAVGNFTVEGVLESIRKKLNDTLAASSRIQALIHQTEPFIKTPTNKIKRKEYITGYQ